MKTSQDIKSVAYIEAITAYAETLLEIRFKNVRKDRYNAACPFHADTTDTFKVYVNKKEEVRFHCFGACKGDWDIYDLIMLRNKCRFRTAQHAWAEYLGVKDFRFYEVISPTIPEPDEAPEPDDAVAFIEPETLDEKMVAAIDDSANFYHDLLVSNEERFMHIWDYLACRGVGKEAIHNFNIGYAPPYSDTQHCGRSLITGFSPRFEKDSGIFKAFSDAGLIRFLNDATVKEYGYYCRQIDFTQKDPFSRNYGDYLAGRIVFPIYDKDARLAGLIGRRPDDRGIRWLNQQTRVSALSPKGWLYGIEKAAPYIRKYRAIIVVEGIFDYFAFYNLLQDQGKPVVVSTLGSYITPETGDILKGLDIEHFIVACNWDEIGRNGIERIAVKSGGWVYYLGGPAEGQVPYDMLKPVVSSISGFSLKSLKTDPESGIE